MSQADIARGFRELNKVKPIYEERKAYAHGTAHERFATSKESALLSFVERDGFRVNYLDTVISAVTDKIELTAITVPDSDEYTELLQSEVWDRNSMLALMDETKRMIGELGDAYWIEWEDETVPDEADAEVTVHLHSPFLMRAVYDNSKPVPLFFVHIWEVKTPGTENKFWRGNVYYEDRIEEWVTTKTDQGSKAVDWDAFIREGADPEDETANIIAHDYGWTAHHFRYGGTPYGRPLHEKGYGAQDAITKLVISDMGAVDYSVLPQRWAIENENADTDAGADTDDFGFDVGQTEAAARRKGAGENSSKLKAKAGSLWKLRGVSEVGEFATADASAFLDRLEYYGRALMRTTGTPTFYISDSGEISGVAKIEADRPTINKARAMARSIASTASQAFATALRILSDGVPDDVHVDVRWAPFSSIDSADGWSVLKQKQDAGVPVRQTLLEAGYTADQLDDWFKEAKPEDKPELTIDQFAALSDAAGKAASAVALGLVTREEARGWIPPALIDTSADAIIDQGGEPTETDGYGADELSQRINAATALIRSGFDPEASLAMVGLDPVRHLGLIPVTVKAGAEPATPADELIAVE